MDKLDEQIRKYLSEQSSGQKLGDRSDAIPTVEEFYLFMQDKLEGSRLEKMLGFLKDNPDWQAWVIKTRQISGETEKAWAEAVVPRELIQKIKNKMPLKANSTLCPHCGKAITPFKKPISQQRLWVVLWALGAMLSFAVSFFISRYFFQFLALTVLFGFKAILDHRAAKTQILIYKALREESEPAHSNRLHQHASHL